MKTRADTIERENMRKKNIEMKMHEMYKKSYGDKIITPKMKEEIRQQVYRDIFEEYRFSKPGEKDFDPNDPYLDPILDPNLFPNLRSKSKPANVANKFTGKGGKDKQMPHGNMESSNDLRGDTKQESGAKNESKVGNRDDGRKIPSVSSTRAGLKISAILRRRV